MSSTHTGAPNESTNACRERINPYFFIIRMISKKALNTIAKKLSMDLLELEDILNSMLKNVLYKNVSPCVFYIDKKRKRDKTVEIECDFDSITVHARDIDDISYFCFIKKELYLYGKKDKKEVILYIEHIK